MVQFLHAKRRVRRGQTIRVVWHPQQRQTHANRRGVAISTSIDKRATVRNRLKRRVYDTIRLRGLHESSDPSRAYSAMITIPKELTKQRHALIEQDTDAGVDEIVRLISDDVRAFDEQHHHCGRRGLMQKKQQPGRGRAGAKVRPNPNGKNKPVRIVVRKKM